MTEILLTNSPVDDCAEGESVLEAEGHVVDGQALVGGQLLPEPVEQRVRTDMRVAAALLPRP